MQYLDALIPLIETAYSDLFKNAAELSDKLDYKASETTRTPLQVVAECVTAPLFLAQTIKGQTLAPMNDETWEKPGLETLAKCEAEWNSVKDELFEAIRTFPSDKLLENIETPWGTFPWRDFIAYCYWNPMWHAGQLAYIQSIHGDVEMHF
jgi:hypothetical protein